MPRRKSSQPESPTEAGEDLQESGQIRRSTRLQAKEEQKRKAGESPKETPAKRKRGAKTKKGEGDAEGTEAGEGGQKMEVEKQMGEDLELSTEEALQELERDLGGIEPTDNPREFKIHRAPLITLWGAMVAEREGYDWNTCLSIGKAISALVAKVKGVESRLGILQPKELTEMELEQSSELREGATELESFGLKFLAKNTPSGLRVLFGKQLLDDVDAIDNYLKSSFKETLDEVKKMMKGAIDSIDKEELSQQAYRLYEQFRPPTTTGGMKGLSEKGIFSLNALSSRKKD